MNILSPDTHPDSEKIWIDGVRQMSAAEKMRRVVELNRSTVPATGLRWLPRRDRSLFGTQ